MNWTAAQSKSIVDVIRTGDRDDLNALIEEINLRHRQLNRESAREVSKKFYLGDPVFFLKGKRDPQVIAGKYAGIQGKWALVEEGHGRRWKVSPSLLHAHNPGA